MLNNYSFFLIASGCVFLAISASLVGCINVYRGQSLIGDALGHASFPGVVLAYILFNKKSPLVLSLGAITFAAISYLLIEFSNKHSKNGSDINLAIYLSGLFGLGILLKTHIQGNKNFVSSSQAGLEKYIFGQASYMMEDDVKIIFFVCLAILLLFICFYREIAILVFDEALASTLGVKVRVVKTVLLILTILVIGVGIKAVGSILISSFLVIPTIGAKLWSKNFKGVLFVSAFTASVSAIIGSVLSTSNLSIATGPAIIACSALISIISIFFAPFGLVNRLVKRRMKI